MQTLEERKAAIMAKAERELRNAEIEHEIRDAWPLRTAPRFIHIHTLWRSVATVKVGDAHYGDSWSVNDAIQMATCFDEIGTFIVRDSCVSFRPTPALQDVDQDRAEVTQVEPYRLKLDHFGDYLEFYALLGEHLCRVEIAVKDPAYRVQARRVRYMGSERWEDSKAIFPNGYFNHAITWWSSGDYPGSFTLYST